MGSANLNQSGWSYVYFIQSGENGPIKIGATSSPTERICALRTANPAPLKCLILLSGAEHEPIMHTLFAESRLQGEWFEPCDELNRFLEEMIELSDCLYEVDGEDVPFLMMPSPRQYDRRGLCVDDVLRVVRDHPDRKVWENFTEKDWLTINEEPPSRKLFPDRRIEASRRPSRRRFYGIRG